MLLKTQEPAKTENGNQHKIKLSLLRRKMPATMEEITASATFVLTRQDRCDTGNCPAQAWVLVKFLTGELLFCSHHFDKFEAALIKDSYEVIDERHRINEKSESSA